MGNKGENPPNAIDEWSFAESYIDRETIDKIRFLERWHYQDYQFRDRILPFSRRVREWLTQFDEIDRPGAMNLLSNLTYIDHNQVGSLVHILVQRILNQIRVEGLMELESITSRGLEEKVEELSSHALYVAMSDDCHIDHVRRELQGIVPAAGRESFVEYYKTTNQVMRKAARLGINRRVFLIDHFCGSGTSAARIENDNGDPHFDGKIPRFVDMWADYIQDARVYYCPLIATEQGLQAVTSILSRDDAPKTVTMLPAMKVPTSASLTDDRSQVLSETRRGTLRRICDKYYKHFRETQHHRVGGGCRYGFADCGLALVFCSNCPNNAIYLIWHQSDSWMPLFRRVEHHR